MLCLWILCIPHQLGIKLGISGFLVFKSLFLWVIKERNLKNFKMKENLLGFNNGYGHGCSFQKQVKSNLNSLAKRHGTPKLKR